MNDGSDSVTMIGLHPLTPRDAADPVSYFYRPLSRRDVGRQACNVVAFPSEAARPPGEVPPAAFGRDAATGRNVIAFTVAAGKIPGRSRKA